MKQNTSHWIALGGWVIAGTWLTAAGIAAAWRCSLYPALLPAAALHICWAAPRAGVHVLLRPGSWAVTAWYCSLGLAAIRPESSAGLWALVLEGLALLAATSLEDRPPLSERLADWRRERLAIAAQLSLSEGMAPWLTACIRRFVHGTGNADSAGGEIARFCAALGDAEKRFGLQLASAALPEAVRQQILSLEAGVMARSHNSAATLAADFERDLLRAAAAASDCCEALTDISPKERDRLKQRASRCFLTLAGLPEPLSRPQGTLQ